MTPMTEAEAVEAIAKRLGWTIEHVETTNAGNCVYHIYRITAPNGYVDTLCYEEGATLGTIHETQDLIESKDALSPVFEKMTEEEKELLWKILWKQWHKNTHYSRNTPRDFSLYLLTLPPRELAFAVAEALRPALDKPEPLP